MDVIMPQLSQTVLEGVVTRWYKKVGDSIKADETLFDVETDKVSTEIPAPASGVVAEILVQEGVTAKVGARLAVIEETAAASAQPTSSTHAANATAAPQASTAVRVSRPVSVASGERLSPVVRRLIAEHQLKPRDIRGTGHDGPLTPHE